MQKFSLIFDKYFFWVVLFLMAFIPLYPKFPLANINGTFVAIRIEDLLITLALLFWCLSMIFSGKLKIFLQDKLNQSLLLFFFIGAVSIFAAIFVTHTVVPHLAILHYLRRIELMLLLPFVYMAIKNKRQVIILLITFSIVILLVNFYALGQKYLGWPVVSTGNSEFSKGLILYLTPGARVNSTFAGHYDLAVFLAMVLVVLSSLFFYFKKIYFKIYIAMLAGLSFVVLIMTAARLSFVAFIFGVTASLILSGKRKLILYLVAVLILVMLYPSPMKDRLISTVTVNIFNSGERYTSQSDLQEERSNLNIPTLHVRVGAEWTDIEISTEQGKLASDITPGEPVNTTQLDVYRSFLIRFDQEWPRAVRALIKNPLLGTGYSSIGLATDNDLLRSFGEVGILGTMCFGLIFVEIIKRLWKIYKQGEKFPRYLSVGILSMVVAFLINSLFIDVFEASKMASLFWIIVGLGLAVGKDEYA